MTYPDYKQVSQPESSPSLNQIQTHVSIHYYSQDRITGSINEFRMYICSLVNLSNISTQLDIPIESTFNNYA